MLKFIREPECKSMTGLERTKRWKLEKEGKFPRRVNISKKAIGWLEHEIQEWIKSKVEESRNIFQENVRQNHIKNDTENTSSLLTEKEGRRDE